MDLRTRLIAPSFLTLGSNKKIFDIDAFVKRTILFETYIIDSERLTEVPHLVRIFTFDGLLALFESGAIRLNCYPRHTGSLGPSLFGDKIPKNGIRPPYNYSIATVTPAEINEYINLSLQEIEPQIGLLPRQLVRLRKSIYKAIEPPGDDEGFSIKATKEDLVSSPSLLARAVVIALNKKLGFQVPSSEIDIAIEYEPDSDFDFKATSNIQKRYDIDQLSAHKIIESACLAIALRNDRIDLMRIHSALTGFSDIDLPIFGEKLAFLASTIAPDVDENRFQRVIELNGLPQIKNGDNVYINARKLLEIRESTESKEFRHWLATTDGMSDTEVIEQVRSLSKTIGRFIGGETGQNIRFLITNSIGFIPVIGTAISMSLSILDHFLLDKFFPRSGVSAFIGDMYPSLFDKSTND